MKLFKEYKFDFFKDADTIDYRFTSYDYLGRLVQAKNLGLQAKESAVLSWVFRKELMVM